MTLYEFRELSEEQQGNEVWNGVFLDLRSYEEHRILLYDLGGFYVEIYYEPKQNKIVKLRPFKSTKPLQPYLDRLNDDGINELL